MRVATVVRALSGIGAATAARLMAQAGIDGGRRVGGLTAGQRERLSAAVAAVDADLAARHGHRVTIPGRCPSPWRPDDRTRGGVAADDGLDLAEQLREASQQARDDGARARASRLR
jgi:hypothetical protein